MAAPICPLVDSICFEEDCSWFALPDCEPGKDCDSSCVGCCDLKERCEIGKCSSCGNGFCDGEPIVDTHDGTMHLGCVHKARVGRRS